MFIPTRPRGRIGLRGFTLVELLVVIGVIAVLLGILFPVVSRAKAQANRALCMSNTKQLLDGLLGYANQNRGYLPHCNYRLKEMKMQASGMQIAGWLYDAQAASGHDPIGPDDLKTGAVWKQLQNGEVFRCPEDDGPFDKPNQRARPVTSYCVNESVSGLEKFNVPYFYKLTQFQGDDIILWEENDSPTTESTTYPFDDGAVNPYRGITRRHMGVRGDADKANGGMVGTAGLGVEWVSFAEFSDWAKQGGRNRVWNLPSSKTGH